jgi:hypothetical protein
MSARSAQYPVHFATPLRTAAKGWHMLRVGLGRKRAGPTRYEGSAEEICEQIVRRCFHPEQRYFMTSRWSYPEFWARDFGRCVPALLTLGFEREVAETYRYALERYERGGAFALVLTPRGKLFDFPAGYAPDGFAFFLLGLAHLGDRALVDRHRAFLEREAERFAALVVDPETGFVRRGVLFSEAQDNAIRDSSCYSNCACLLARQSLAALGLRNPLDRFDHAALVERFWDGDHYADDLRGLPYPSGDAQIFPLWCGAVSAKGAARARLDVVLAWLDRQGLNAPLPGRYGTGPAPERRMHLVHWINPWQEGAVWTCLGLHLLEVLRDHRHPRWPVELARYRALVERERCFPEVLDGATGELFAGPVLLSEDSMLWAASFWQLLRDARTMDAGRHRAGAAGRGDAAEGQGEAEGSP